MNLCPEAFFDPNSGLLTTLISCSTSTGSVALAFDPQAGTFLAQCRIESAGESDKLRATTHGIHVERGASILQRMTFDIASGSDGRHGRANATSGQVARTLPSKIDHPNTGRGSDPVPSPLGDVQRSRAMLNAATRNAPTFVQAAITTGAKVRMLKYTWGRGASTTDVDESWMLEKRDR